jgi:WD40 repeat protein
MFRPPVRLTLIALLALWLPHAGSSQGPATAGPAPKQEPKRDRHGDPLPDGAVARLGTSRFRHESPLRFVAFSPDGTKIVSSAGSTGFQVWEAGSGRLLRHLPGNLYSPSSAAFSPDSKKLALASGDLKPRLWDLATGKELRQLPPPSPNVPFVALAPDGKTVASLNHDQSIWLGDLTADGPPRQFVPPFAAQAPERRFATGLLAFSPGGKVLAAAGADGRGVKVRLWEVPGGRELLLVAPENLPGGLACLVFSPNGKLLAVGNGQAVVLVEVASGKQVGRVAAQRSGNSAVAFSPDGKLLAVGNFPAIDLVELATGKTLRRLPDPHRGPPGLAFSPDSKVLAVGGSSHSIRLWDVATGDEVRPVGHHGALGAVACSPDGKTVATAGADHTVRLWEAATGRELRRLTRPDLKPEDEQRLGSPQVAFLRGGRRVAAAWWDGVVCVWDTASGKEVSRSGAPRQSLGPPTFSPDGELVACTGPNAVLHVREVIGGREVRRVPSPKQVIQSGNAGNPTAVAFGADGRTLATAHSGQHFTGGIGPGMQPSYPNRTVRVWELNNGRLRGVLSLDPPPPAIWYGGSGFRGGFGGGGFGGGGFGGGGLQPRGLFVATPVSVLVFSPNGRTMAVSGGDGVRLWDLRANRELVRLLGAHQPSLGATFSPDGRVLAVGGQGWLKLYAVGTGEQLCHVTAGQGGIHALTFSRDGKFLVSTGTDTTALVWDVQRLHDEGRREAELSVKRLEGLWADLAGADAMKADQASWSLAETPKGAVPFLAARLQPVPAVPAEKLDQLVKDLNHARYAVRVRSMGDLEALRDVAVPALRKALEGAPLEVMRRVESLLAKVDGAEPIPERLRELRAVEALERAGTAEAVAVLRRLAGGAPQAQLTREAQGSLERLSRRKAAAP